MKNLSLDAAIAAFAGLALEIASAEHEALTEAAKIIAREAKDELGTYQDAVGPVPAWEPLAEATKEDRAARGFAPDEPLLRTGALRDSIGYEVGDKTAVVGSTSEYARVQELGDGKVPGRSFLQGAAYRKEHEVAEKVGATIIHGLKKG